MEQKKDNVIHFPNRKPVAEPVAENPSNPPPVPNKVTKKKVASGIVGVLIAAVIANHWAPESGQSDMASSAGGRGIASVDSRIVDPLERDTQWESRLAKDLAKTKQDSPSLGRRPSSVEELRFARLKSIYAIHLADSKVHEILLPEDQSDVAVYVGPGDEFLLEYQDVLPVEFSAVSAKARVANNESILETYALKDDSGRQVGEARFDLDRYGRLVQFAVRSSQ